MAAHLPRVTGAGAPLRRVVVVGVALLILWAVSWSLSYVALGTWSLAVALAIAGAKAVLVALFFMELAHERTSLQLAVASAVALVAIFIALVVGDVVTRQEVPFVPASPPPPVEVPE